ncbi:MAG: PAS domain-containing protein [Oscillospiraceae bacterium]|jgi:predicted transcriptional regulator YheO|nr:PAS domain-containing protein [Oscillospiraceae bacterium]
MTDKELLDSYYPLISFLSKLCGPSCEVLLNDVSRPESAVVAIAGGCHSGREIGSPMTDFARDIIKNKTYQDSDSVSNYTGAGKGKNFVSSTFFIKNEGRLIGLLCINRDMSVLTQAEAAFELIKKQYNLVLPSDEVQEVLDAPVSVILHNMVEAAINESCAFPDRLKKSEKEAIVIKLKNQGVLRMKGAVAEIARQLRISEPTVYRYINSEKS